MTLVEKLDCRAVEQDRFMQGVRYSEVNMTTYNAPGSRQVMSVRSVSFAERVDRRVISLLIDEVGTAR
jgi:hypothetical protein